MKEMVFHLAIWAYPGMAIVYAFWAFLNLGAKRTMSNHMNTANVVPDWLTGIHFLTQAVAFYLLYFATKGLPIDTNAFSFIIRMWWTASFLTGFVMTIWHFVVIYYRYWRKDR